jgi:hypothetical protein
LNQSDVQHEAVDERGVPFSSRGILEFVEESGSEELIRILVLAHVGVCLALVGICSRRFSSRNSVVVGSCGRRGAASAIHEVIDLSLVDFGFLEAIAVILEHGRSLVDLGELIELKGLREGIRQLDGLGEGREDDVAKLDPTTRNEIAQRLVVQEQEVREVVEEENEDLEQAAIEEHRGLRRRVGVARELVSELDGVSEHAEVRIPAALVAGEQTCDEDAVREKFNPTESETGNLSGVQVGVKSERDDVEELVDGLCLSSILLRLFVFCLLIFSILALVVFVLSGRG